MSTTTIQRDIAAKPPAPPHPEPPDPDHSAPDTPEPDADAATRAIPEQAPPADLKSRYAATRSDAGMSTAEYAVGTLAAVAFALLLIKVINSPEILDALTALVDRALNSAG
ncbi:DUF4244 domain-containing protein [Nonomuraea sp. NPDC059023]|uniref:DUF4244 domain-containing protein n=1 Tax=unclassified Nonomuraea TaxID=2593643 RepID=UPI00369A71DC